MPVHIPVPAARVAVAAAATAAAALVGVLPAVNPTAAPATAPPVAPSMQVPTVSLPTIKIVDARTMDAVKATPRASFRRPVRMVTGPVTSGFGRRWGSFHQGLDIGAPIGTPIRAPLPGTVISSGPASGFGLWVRLRHPDGTITVYGHINRSLVRVGQRVATGQEIAEVGNRGDATGPHLHIEVVMPNGRKINPRPWLDQHRVLY